MPLFPYQIRGALFAACRGRVVLADDMGLGKTIQAIAAAELLRRRRGIERVLVVAPASVKYQWKTEIEKFCGLSAQVIDGPMPHRKKLYASPAFFNLTSYELVLKDIEDMHNLRPDLIILDEAQRIRNWATATARTIKQLKSRYAFVLTGTPLENKLEELLFGGGVCGRPPPGTGLPLSQGTPHGRRKGEIARLPWPGPNPSSTRTDSAPPDSPRGAPGTCRSGPTRSFASA